MKKILKIQRGFSLVEILVYMGLFAILLIPLLQLFSSTIAVRLESEATSAVAQDGRYIIARLTYDIHRANSITVPDPATLQISGTGFAYTYSVDGGKNLSLNDGATSYVLNSEGTSIPQISFTLKGNSGGVKVVSISVQVESKVIRQGGNKELKTFETVVGNRL